MEHNFKSIEKRPLLITWENVQIIKNKTFMLTTLFIFFKASKRGLVTPIRKWLCWCVRFVNVCDAFAQCIFGHCGAGELQTSTLRAYALSNMYAGTEVRAVRAIGKFVRCERPMWIRALYCRRSTNTCHECVCHVQSACNFT